MKNPQHWIAGGLVVIGILCFAAVLVLMNRSAGMMMPMPGMYRGMWLIPGTFLVIILALVVVVATGWSGLRRKDALRFCPQCHESVQHQWRYCPYCGSRVGE